ncbi:hypothetical protein, conserved [Eimeria tenella]|uniref:Uncharacterized protein n=1 Tax=Eimeria tenella TaxID=5802 RepID=U6KQZ3_EIMTE|nr:hypothetical protein, conserved [Eimeria tenella]CDJ40522.1 hypothetical protein, conserved [Eimeria tenella]|eukprot:XP_013231272.1 hypothetical protein, conserved [Eimeria tenella]
MLNSSLLHRMQPIRRAGALVSRQVSGSSSARSFSTEGGRLLNPNPRPTQYQTVIVNEAVNPAPGKPFSFTPYIVGLGVFMFVFPCMQTTMELRKYYKETEHLYRDGWNRHHYDKMKDQYLS